MSSSSESSRSSTPEPPAVTELQEIDQNLPPIQQHSLQEWVARWKELSDCNREDERDTFALTGHYNDPHTGERRRAAIDLSNNRPGDEHVFHQHCDVDSVIGIVTGALPVLSPAVIKYFMLQSISHTLDKSVHLPPVEVMSETGQVKGVPLHKIPNARFFQVDDHILVRIFFPGLVKDRGGSIYVPEANLEQFYDFCVFVAAQTTLPEDAWRCWPTSFKAEQLRARKGATGRGMQHSGRDVHAAHLNPWIDECRRIAALNPRLKWTAGFFFVFEMRGLKLIEDSVHSPPEEELVAEDGTALVEDHPRFAAVERVLKHLDTDEIAKGGWYLDIATTITISDTVDSPSACLFASAGTHAHVLEHLSGLTWEESDRYVSRGGRRYQKDEVAHLNDVAGFRFSNTLADSRDSGIFYIQVYSTEKSVTYNINSAQNAQRTTPKKILRNWRSERDGYVSPLCEAFKQSSATHGVALRLETRCDYNCYPNLHHRIPESDLQRWFLRLEKDDFWSFKQMRATSIRSTLDRWVLRRPRFAAHMLPEVGTMLILLSFMLGALANRPNSGDKWQEVHDVACVHVEQGGVFRPVRPLGALFLPAVRLEPGLQPRASCQRTIRRERILYLLGDGNDPVTEYNYLGIIRGHDQAPKRRLEGDAWSTGQGSSRIAPAPHVPNKQRRVHVPCTEDVEDQFTHVAALNSVAVPRYGSEPREWLPDEGAPQSIGLTQLICRYPAEIMLKAPNHKTGGSWCELSVGEREDLHFDFFSDKSNLQRSFLSYIIVPESAEKWNKTVKLLFPTLQVYEKTKKHQGLGKITARHDFALLLRSLTEEGQADVIREAIRYVSRHWTWLPYGSAKQHLWTTGSQNIPAGAESTGEVGGPWFVVNSARFV
ncbi:hypothetical protein FRC12_012975 [Ceratobasidium sp. 428]|nr:hypothetical protein FRC12_012975 [Ceratobasidium sp. 428]